MSLSRYRCHLVQNSSQYFPYTILTTNIKVLIHYLAHSAFEACHPCRCLHAYPPSATGRIASIGPQSAVTTLTGRAMPGSQIKAVMIDTFQSAPGWLTGRCPYSHKQLLYKKYSVFSSMLGPGKVSQLNSTPSLHIFHPRPFTFIAGAGSVAVTVIVHFFQRKYGTTCSTISWRLNTFSTHELPIASVETLTAIFAGMGPSPPLE